MYHIIVNPASRSGRGRHIWTNIIKPALTARNVSYNVHFSKRAGDVRLIAEEIISSAEGEEPLRLLILGGDGTVNEALQGIADPSRVLIGYIPTGSSNDLARDLGIPKKPLEALTRILDAGDSPDGPQVRSMDRGLVKVGEVCRFFAVSSGVGFDAAVCEEAMRSRIKDVLNRMKLGKLTYLWIALKQLFASQKIACDLYLDDAEPIHIKKLFFAAFMIHRFEGGGFKFCPTADDADGLIDLCVVGNLPKLLVLFALPTAFFGTHYIFPGITHYRAKRIKIKTSSPLWLHTDGEVHEQTDRLEVSCIQKDIRFIL